MKPSTSWWNGNQQLRTTLYKNIAASPAEREAIKEFLDKGIDVKIQVIPADKVVEVKDIL